MCIRVPLAIFILTSQEGHKMTNVPLCKSLTIFIMWLPLLSYDQWILFSPKAFQCQNLFAILLKLLSSTSPPKYKSTEEGLYSLTNQKEQLDLCSSDYSFVTPSQSKDKQYLMITYQERLKNAIAQTWHFEWQMG